MVCIQESNHKLHKFYYLKVIHFQSIYQKFDYSHINQTELKDLNCFRIDKKFILRTYYRFLILVIKSYC